MSRIRTVIRRGLWLLLFVLVLLLRFVLLLMTRHNQWGQLEVPLFMMLWQYVQSLNPK